MQWPPLPDYGCIARWPADGQSFIHPDDVATATRCFPSERVLKRESFDGTYYHFRYGKNRFRLRPCMWLKVQHEGIDIGDQVETIGTGLERELFVAEVWGMHYIRRKGRIAYRLRRGDQVLPRLYSIDHLKLLTDKASVRDGDVEYPEPKWTGDQTNVEKGLL
ncbi:hypothetical protein N9N28_14690 [Rubripirellula amarantea]|nr:hypothetical protein [Rubripirellula amarantea]